MEKKENYPIEAVLFVFYLGSRRYGTIVPL